MIEGSRDSPHPSILSGCHMLFILKSTCLQDFAISTLIFLRTWSIPIFPCIVNLFLISLLHSIDVSVKLCDVKLLYPRELASLGVGLHFFFFFAFS